MIKSVFPFLAAVILAGIANGGDVRSTPTGDGKSPGRLAFVSPESDAVFNAGACVPLQVKMDANAASVRFYDGAALLGEAAAPSYRLMWTTASRGPHTVRAVADNDGEASVRFTINDPTAPVNLADDVDRYNVTYTTLGENARDSMPLGNGDISLNVWTYANGDVGLLIGKMDAYSEAPGQTGSRGYFSLRKIGRVRIAMDPPLFKQAADAGGFRQTLVMSDAAIRFIGKCGELKVWVDKNRPVIHAEYAGKTAAVMTVRDDPWRTEEVALTHFKDIIFPGLTNQIAWCYYDPRTDTSYRNAHEKTLVESGAPGADLMPQYTTVAFGALIEGVGLNRVDDKTLRSGSTTQCQTDINVLRYSKQSEATPAQWLSLIQAQTEQNRAVTITDAWNEHCRWWGNYWDRGSILITKGEKHFEVTSQYLQQRFVSACQSGAVKELWRIPFNGGLFNVDLLDFTMKFRGKEYVGLNIQDPRLKMTADFRLWGASDRSQNTRHVYWPMLMSGDYDVARAWYLWPAVIAKSWEKATLEYSGLRDCFAPTGPSAWEKLLPIQFVKRWDLAAKRIVPEAAALHSSARRMCIDTTDEYLPYMIDYYELTQDEDFLRNYLLPYARGLFRFFDEFYSRDRKGKLLLWPCQQSEIYVRYPETGFVPANPVSGVAMLHSQLPRLLALADKPGVDAKTVALWKRVYEARPPMPVAKRRNGKVGLVPHEPGWDEESRKTQGADRATLYAIWPYRAYMFPQSGTTPTDYAIAKNTLDLDDNGSWGWTYGDYCAAILGLSGRAKQGVIDRAFGISKGVKKSEEYFRRFPLFMQITLPDWTPNPESPGIMQSTLQYMLWNWKGQKIYVCPAWPRDWDCTFKFRGPQNTLVQGHVTGGQVTIDKVVPESRRRDIVVCPPQ